MTTDNLTALEARDNWLSVAHHWPQLTAALAGRTGGGLTGMPAAASPERQLPIDVHVSDLMHEITGAVEFYARVLMDETTWRPTTSHMPQLLVEVATRYGHFTVTEQEFAFTDDAHEYADKVRRTLNPTSRPTYIGPCQTTNCPGELRLREDQEHARCPDCGTVTTIQSQRMWLRGELEDRLMTPTELMQALKTLGTPVTDRTVWRWIAKGKLEPVDDGLYPLTKAAELAAGKMSSGGERSVA